MRIARSARSSTRRTACWGARDFAARRRAWEYAYLDPGTLASLALIPLCLLLLAMDVAAETALVNISHLRLRQLLDRGVPRARTLAALMNESRLRTVLRTANLILAGLITALLLGVTARLALGLAETV